MGDPLLPHGILVRYSYDGDEAAWRAAVDPFLAALDGDDRASGRFTYSVCRTHDGGRAHIARWLDAGTLAHVQAQPYFRSFSGAVQGFAGDSLTSTRLDIIAETA